jgi:hypothetical protein
MNPPTRNRKEDKVTPTEENEGNETHRPGGMDGIDDEPVRESDDDDAPGGMTGIPPDPEDDRRKKSRQGDGG